ncbi:MAG TPA: hemerythrin domain-containing protein [Mycobacteriales bacterium]|nr:hemerythrin domain-containing protein [Mycobacteriales bacterium]
MTEHKSMNSIIHDAFRRDLRRFDVALADPGAANPQRADQLSVAWDNFAKQLHDHHEDEENIFWPAVRSLGVDTTLAGELESEHAQMLTALDKATAAMQSYRTFPSADSAGGARISVGELAAVLTSHLDHEEADLDPFAAEHEDSSQMKNAQKAVRRAHRGNTGTFFAWLLDGASDADARGLRETIPPPVLAMIVRIGGRNYRRTIAPTWRGLDTRVA